MKSKLTTLLLACGSVVASPLAASAQDGRLQPETIKPAEPTRRPQPESDRKPGGERKRSDDRDYGDRDRDRGRRDGEHRDGSRGPGEARGEHRERPKVETKPVTYLGLLTRGLSPELAAQSGLPEGFGLLVADVMKDSPAKTAGFEKYDVLVLLGDQRIVNLDQFQALIRAQKKGDEVTLTVRRKGAEVKVSAKLGEHALPAAAAHGAHPMMHRGAMGKGHRPPFMHPGLPDAGKRVGEMRERMEHFRKEMRERFEHRRDGEHGPGPTPPRFGAGPMSRDGGHKGPPMMNREGGRPNAEHGDRGPGPRAEGPHSNGPRPDGPPGAGPRGNGPRPDGPPGAGPRGNGPRPDGDGHREGGRPNAEHGDRGPGPGGEGPRGNPQRPDAPPPGGPRPGGDAPPPRA